MTHPLIPYILELATPVAASLDLELVGAVFRTNQSPPVLRVDIRNLKDATGLDDCERMSRALEAILDESEIFPATYTLEVSSPGISRTLNTDRDFISFKGFTVTVGTCALHAGYKEWIGKLVRRDQEAVHLSQKGRAIAIPRHLIDKVQIVEQS
jgi:ribosome maturation factor RimP